MTAKSETPKPGDPAFARSATRIIAAPQASHHGCGRGGGPSRLSPAHPWRCAGGRGEGSRQSDGWNRASGRRARPTGWLSPAFSSRGEKRRSQSGAQARAEGTSNSCCRWRSNSMAGLESSLSPATPMASTGPKRSQARSSLPTASRGPLTAGSKRSQALLADNDAHRLFRRVGRSGRHWADADQRQRLPRRAHQLRMSACLPAGATVSVLVIVLPLEARHDRHARTRSRRPRPPR